MKEPRRRGNSERSISFFIAGAAGVLGVGSGAVAAIASTAGAAVLGTTFGVTGAGLSGYKVGQKSHFMEVVAENRT